MLPVQFISKQVGIDKYVVYSWFSCMNTRVDIFICDKKEEESKRIIQSISDLLKRFEKIGNYFEPSSELAAINNSGCDVPISVNSELFAMIKMCIDYNKMSAGYFDITVNSDNYTGDTLQHVYISEKDSSITLKKNGIKLDLSGFIKGYSLDKAKDILKANGIENALVNIGNSSVLALGNHPMGEGWKVGVDFPTAPNHLKEIILKDKCLTTSGNQSLGRKHIKSPRTGEYIEGISGVSVLTDTATDGEVLSTALFAAEPEKRPDILKNFDTTIYTF